MGVDVGAWTNYAIIVRMVLLSFRQSLVSTEPMLERRSAPLHAFLAAAPWVFL